MRPGRKSINPARFVGLLNEINMKSNITNEDVLNLQKEFKEYYEHAEQHEFTKLTMVDFMLERNIQNLNSIDNTARNAMFRVIYKLIGKDYSEYK